MSVEQPYECIARAHGFGPHVFLDLLAQERSFGYRRQEAYDRALARLAVMGRRARLLMRLVVGRPSACSAWLLGTGP